MAELERQTEAKRVELGVMFPEQMVAKFKLKNHQDILYRVQKGQIEAPRKVGQVSYWAAPDVELITTADVAEMKGIDVRTVQKMVTKGVWKPVIARRGQMFFLRNQDFTVSPSVVGRRPAAEALDADYMTTEELLNFTAPVFGVA